MKKMANKKEEKIIEIFNKKIEEFASTLEKMSQNAYSKDFFAANIQSITESIEYMKQTIITIIASMFDKMNEKSLRESQITKEFYQYLEEQFEQKQKDLKGECSKKIKELHETEEYQNYHLTNDSKDKLASIVLLEKYYRKESKILDIVDICLFLFEEEIKNRILKKKRSKKLEQEVESALEFYHLYLENTEEFDPVKFEKYLEDCKPILYKYATETLQSDIENLMVAKLEELELPKIFPSIISKIKERGFFYAWKDIKQVLKQNEILKSKEEEIKAESKEAQEKEATKHEELIKTLKVSEKLKLELINYLHQRFEIKDRLCLQDTAEERLFLELLNSMKQDKDILENLEQFFQMYYSETLEEQKLDEYNRNFKIWQESYKMQARKTGCAAEEEISRFHRFDWITTLERKIEGLEIQKTILEEERKKYGPKVLLFFSKKRKKDYRQLEEQLREKEVLLSETKQELSKKKKYFEQDSLNPYKEKNFINEKNQNMQKIMYFLRSTNEIIIPMPNPKTQTEISYKKAFENVEEEFNNISVPKESMLLDFLNNINKKYMQWNKEAQEKINITKYQIKSLINPFIELLCKTYGCELQKEPNRIKIEAIREVLELLQKFKLLIENNKLSSLTPIELKTLNQVYTSEIKLPVPSERSISEDIEYRLEKKKELKKDKITNI